MNRKNIFGNFFLNVANMILPIIILPILTRTLDNHSFGIYSVFLSILAFASVIIDYGLSNFGTRDIAKAGAIHKSYFLVAIKVRLLLSLVVFIVFLPINYFSGLIPLNPIILLSVLFGCVGYAIQPIWIYNGLQQTNKIILSFLSWKFVISILIVLHSYYFKDVYGILLLNSLLILVPSIVSSKDISKILIEGDHKNEYILDFLKRGFPIAFSSFISIFLNGSITLVAKWYLGFQVAGNINIIDKISRGSLSILAPFTTSMFPYVSMGFGISKQEGIKRIIQKGLPLVLLYVVMAIFICLFSKPILSIFGENYTSLSNLLYISLLWATLSLVNNLIGVQFMVGSGNDKIYSALYTVISVFLLIFFIFLPKAYGAKGILISIALSEALFTLACSTAMIFVYRRM